MLPNYTEQYGSASKSFFDSQFAAFTTMVGITMQVTEKIVALNMAAVKASAGDCTAAAKELQTAKDLQEFFSLASALVKPGTDKIAAYNQHLTDIVSVTKAEYTKFTEAQVAQGQTKVNDFLEAITKNSPAGSENLVAMLKSSIASANDGYKKMSSTAKQAVETTEVHVAKAAAGLTESIKTAAAK
jgi:phasin family protein